MSEQSLTFPQPYCVTRCTFLVPEVYYRAFFGPGPYVKIGHSAIATYLSALMEDPLLDYKLSFLVSSKWKTEYQKPGQSLRRVNFYPDDLDWARLSAMSVATGFSRCYIFVFLMLVHMGVLSLEDGGTPPVSPPRTYNSLMVGTLWVNGVRRIITRKMEITAPP